MYGTAPKCSLATSQSFNLLTHTMIPWICVCAQCTRWQKRWRVSGSLSWRPGELWRDMATRFCVWTGVRTRGGSSAPRRSDSTLVFFCHFLQQSLLQTLKIILSISDHLMQDGKVIVWDAFTTNKVRRNYTFSWFIFTASLIYYIFLLHLDLWSPI